MYLNKKGEFPFLSAPLFVWFFLSWFGGEPNIAVGIATIILSGVKVTWNLEKGE